MLRISLKMRAKDGSLLQDQRWIALQLLMLMLFLSGTIADSFLWRTSAWTDCFHYSCGEGGIQRREVWCAHESGWATDESNCKSRSKPPDQQACFHICDYHKHHFLWKTGSWSECEPQGGSSSCQGKYGVQRREVVCVTKCGESLSPDYICEYFTVRPPSSRICKLKCPQDCIMTEFGPWTICNQCWMQNQTRTRNILALPSGGGRECGPLADMKFCDNRNSCSNKYKMYRYKVKQWSVCDHLDPQKWNDIKDYMGIIGLREREIYCIDERGATVNERFCEELTRPTSSELCVFPRDCLVSRWSNWTIEKYPYERNTSLDDVIRSRDVLQLPRGAGDNCPDLREVRPATYEEMRRSCFKYTWQMGTWDSCKLQRAEDKCGSGMQHRRLICVRTQDNVPVPLYLCDPPKPSQVRPCEIPCPMDCVVSPWSDWGECLPHRCKLARGNAKPGYRMRERKVMRDGLHGGTSCPHFKEMQPCHYPPCYTWQVTSSSPCALKYPELHCGEGMQNRTVECISRRATVVSSRLCYDPEPAHREACSVPCENDCVISDWSEWTTCSKSCGVRRQSGFRYRSREMLAHPTAGGQPCPPFRTLTEKQRCNEFPCVVYYWLPSNWGACDVGDRKCGHGVQTREVHCFADDNEKTAKRCPMEEKPDTRRNCTIPCPRPCRVSQFSDWTPCPVTCYDEKTLPTAFQERYRFVLDEPDEGGTLCPEIKELRPCTSLPRCISYKWQAAPWGQCLFPDRFQKCGDGYRARVVKCVQGKDQVVSEEFCIRQHGSMPEVATPCHVPCDVTVCKFSDWLPYSHCPLTCGGHRARSRFMEGYTERIAECYDKTRYPTEESLSCPCTHFQAQPMDEWSDCVLDPEYTQEGTAPTPSQKNNLTDIYIIATSSASFSHCGVGRRTQAMVCRDPEGQNFSSTVCGSKAFMEEMCFTPCPRDCVMSQWSTWSSCIVDKCGNGYQNRSRYMVESELDGGRPCPQLIQGEEYQSRPCHVACDRYLWVSGDWSSCSPVTSMAKKGDCGAGLQSRVVKCMKNVAGGEEDSIEVEEDLCDKLVKPKDINYCHVPCPGQCVVTEWSAWTTCPQTCELANRRLRMRTVVRKPSRTSSAKCPHLQETESCVDGVSCFRYEWRWSSWSACLLDEGAVCGRGRRMRFKECQRGNHRVANELCYQYVGQPPDHRSEEDCIVACPVDCVVTEWSQWTPCSLTCSLGSNTRQRNVLIESAGRGRSCPQPLQQRRPCAFSDCYKWVPSHWSDCVVQKGACGFGRRTRNFLCQRFDGQVTPPGHCAHIHLPHEPLEEECSVGCPGDCKVSEWSVWGSCQRPCTPEGDQVGIQVRSRAILAYPGYGGEACSPDLHQSRLCDHGPCVTYTWHASLWQRDRRTVWCESSDGMSVTGGCLEAEKPASVKTCDPPCDVIEHSYCQDAGSCGCLPGYRAIYEIHHELVECIFDKMAGRNLTKNGDITAENQALYRPEDGIGNLWMYAVIAAGFAFVIFVVVALYTVCRHSHRGNGEALRKRQPATDTGDPHESQTPLMMKKRSDSITITRIDLT